MALELRSIDQQVIVITGASSGIEIALWDIIGKACNQPVYLMDELVRQVPEGTYLRSFKQAGQKVTLNGYA